MQGELEVRYAVRKASEAPNNIAREELEILEKCPRGLEHLLLRSACIDPQREFGVPVAVGRRPDDVQDRGLRSGVVRKFPYGPSAFPGPAISPCGGGMGEERLGAPRDESEESDD